MSAAAERARKSGPGITWIRGREWFISETEGVHLWRCPVCAWWRPGSAEECSVCHAPRELQPLGRWEQVTRWLSGRAKQPVRTVSERQEEAEKARSLARAVCVAAIEMALFLTAVAITARWR